MQSTTLPTRIARITTRAERNDRAAEMLRLYAAMQTAAEMGDEIEEHRIIRDINAISRAVTKFDRAN